MDDRIALIAAEQRSAVRLRGLFPITGSPFLRIDSALTMIYAL
jgi:hypothetical protein